MELRKAKTLWPYFGRAARGGGTLSPKTSAASRRKRGRLLSHTRKTPGPHAPATQVPLRGGSRKRRKPANPITHGIRLSNWGLAEKRAQRGARPHTSPPTLAKQLRPLIFNSKSSLEKLKVTLKFQGKRPIKSARETNRLVRDGKTTPTQPGYDYP